MPMPTPKEIANKTNNASNKSDISLNNSNTSTILISSMPQFHQILLPESLGEGLSRILYQHRGDNEAERIICDSLQRPDGAEISAKIK